MTSSSFVSPLDCLTSFLGISLSRAVSSFGRITNVSKSAITAETYIRSWRKPPEIPEVCRMGDRKTETVIRLTGAAYVYQNTSQTKCTNGSRPSAGAVYIGSRWSRLARAQNNPRPELELLSPSTTYPLLQQSKGWQIRMEHLWLQMNLTPSWISWRDCTHQ